MLAQISKDDVTKVKVCNCHISIPNTRPGMIIAPLAHQAHASIIL